jgi:hypothetical protein
MEEARASWNTAYLTRDGFECQITLRDDDETQLFKRIVKILAWIREIEGTPLRRKIFIHEGNRMNPDARIYIDEHGVPRCNLRLKDGSICKSPVIEKHGRYGRYWFCPNYRQHADSTGSRKRTPSTSYRKRR